LNTIHSVMNVSKGFDIDSSLDEIFVLVQWVVKSIEVLVWWTMMLLKTSVVGTHTEVTFHLVFEVLS
jgi:hypothetical protein